jgi:hypothetical protein
LFFYIKPNKQLLTLKKNNVLFMRWESQNPGSVGRALAWVGENTSALAFLNLMQNSNELTDY